MKRTLSLVAYPGDRILWQVGDRLLVTLFEDEPYVPRPYKVIYVDPHRVSLEVIDR